MLKVSFKEDYMRVQTFNDKATVVTMTGRVDLPDFWDNIPHIISNWMYDCPSIEVDATWNQLILISKGKSVCADEDTFDEEIGYRIAESRAMIKIYKFMEKLTDKLCQHYFKVLYGDADIHNIFYNQKDESLYAAHQRYQALLIKESQHLGKLLEEA